jgi:16S rRNA (adenine1518-N6/adenine1519-N6)-dimethyltransferase
LRERWRNDSRIEIVEADAAATDLTQWGAGVLAGNLPYYVATALISRYLRRPGMLRHATFLIQEEVAARVTARPGTRDYGYLSVECQFLGRPEYLFRVPPGAFQPPPKVDSAVIRIEPRKREKDEGPRKREKDEEPRKPREIEETEPFLQFVSACFRHKRKTLRNNLAALYPREFLDRQPGISRRAEQLTIQDFLSLFRLMKLPPETSATMSSAAVPGSGTVDTTDDGA